MKATMRGLLCAAMTIGLDVLSAGEVNWAGGGDTAAWSDPGNWGGALPTSEDVAVIDGVVPATLADVQTMNGFAGVKIDGENAAVSVYGMTSGISMTVPLLGTGTLSVTNSANSASLVLNNDNSGFSGTFYTDGAGLTLSNPKSSGSSATKAVIRNGSTSKYFRVPYQSGKAMCKEFTGDIAFENTEVWANPSGGFEFSGMVDIRSGTTQFYSDNGDGYTMRFSNLVTNTTSKSSEFRLKAYHRITETCTIALGTNSSVHVFQGGRIYLDGNVASAKSFIVNDGILNFGGADRFPPNLSVSLGGNGQYPRKARLRLNGFSQRCGNLRACNSDMSNNHHGYYDTAQLSIPPSTYMNADNTNQAGYITSSAPATFTVLGSYVAEPDNSNYTMVQRRRFIYPIQGHASFELNSTNQATAATMRFSSPRSDTDGSLICRRGTIVLESTSAFANLSSIVASNEGAFTVEAGAAITPDVSVELSDSSVFTVGEGCVVTAKTAKVGESWLWPGEYICADAGYANLAGPGKLVVLNYGGPRGAVLIFR